MNQSGVIRNACLNRCEDTDLVSAPSPLGAGRGPPQVGGPLFFGPEVCRPCHGQGHQTGTAKGSFLVHLIEPFRVPMSDSASEVRTFDALKLVPFSDTLR
jgi:hypothetical protein